MGIKAYAQLTRAHTAPLETVPALIGGLLATGGDITSGVLIWGVFGVLYHLTGYGMNSYTDWMSGYDKDDPNKSHHPLNTGELTGDRALVIVLSLTIVTFALAGTMSRHSILAIALLIGMVLFGVIYNLLGKITNLKFIPICISHSLVFALPYVALGGDLYRQEFIFGFLYVFLWVMFQISVSGEVMQLTEEDQSNFLRDTLGVRAIERPVRDLDEKVIIYGSRARIYGFSVKWANLIVGGIAYVILYNATSAYSIERITLGLFWLIEIALITLFTHMLLRDGRYWRDWRTHMVSRIEMLTAFLMVIVFYPVIGARISFIIILGSVLWVTSLNKYQWGTILTPKV